LIWLAILLLSPVVVLTRAPEYTLVQLFGDGRPSAINERGHIVGTIGGYYNPKAVMWDDDGSILAMNTTPGVFSYAYGINNRGQVVGYTYGRGAVLWEDATTIGLDGIALGEIAPAAINERGQIVGSIPTAIANERHAALWQDGTIIDLGVLPGDISSEAVAINDRSEIIGRSYSGAQWRAVIWDKGTLSELPGISGQSTAASDINNRGQVVGVSGSLPVMWENGIPVLLETLPNLTRGSAAGINDNGDIVGTLAGPTSWPRVPVLWRNGRPVALPALSYPIPFASYDVATDINNSGTIIGYRTFNYGEGSGPLLWVRNAQH
jgi:probable HAF family extracellular repeat protein